MERELERPTPEEMLRAAAEHAWNNSNGNYRHRRQFEAIGINSKEELTESLDKAAKHEETRSFDRQPDPERRQTQHSTIVQAKIIDQHDKEHQVTVILNPDRDEDGRLYGGTAYLNDPKRRPDIHRQFQDERDRGNDPRFVLRGADLSRAAAESTITPGQRLIKSEPPAYDDEKKPMRDLGKDESKSPEKAQEPPKRETYVERMRRLNPMTDAEIEQRERDLAAQREKERQRDSSRSMEGR